MNTNVKTSLKLSYSHFSTNFHQVIILQSKEHFQAFPQAVGYIFNIVNTNINFLLEI